MNKRRKKARRSRKSSIPAPVIAGICCAVIVCVVIAAFFIIGTLKNGGSQSAYGDIGKLIINSEERQDEYVAVDTSYGSFKYPYAFSDLIHIDPVNDGEYSVLEFTAEINGITAKLFSFYFNYSDIGTDVGTVKLSGGQNVNVSVEFYDPVEGLAGDDLTTFYAVKETFNDVLVSFAENDNFTLNE